ncbi:hypothetical protein MLD38_028752 [Melastoma candidum]|uniref:Uncharacterized protein n=1 Tax=Melastoma candidum TaxID=119954 RepID=A0ACB9N1L8_9MYRT|nr:hypothetical protein MLD38_028752 [Melastoma candidum]
MAEEEREASFGEGCLHKFRVYETQSYFYLTGQNKNKNIWRVLKISRLECSELSIVEDPTIYTQLECYDLLERIHEGNKSTGGLKFVTVCYGIIGIVKFLGPYYILLIKKRRKIGTICGHTIYAITKSEIITIPNSAVQSDVSVSKDENRYKRLLGMMDLTKDFYYSYTYRVMSSLQKNVCNIRSGQHHHETMFVWNEYLTRKMKESINSNLWTVALVYGFFKQVHLSVSNKDLILTLIARRSRFYAGTRYLRRGVNRKGKVANDVETEQIIMEDNLDGSMKISSAVQVRGSIPLFWSQDSSKFVLKPDIILSKKDVKYEATRLHFEDLSKRYGNPIVVLNLIKSHETKPRETILLSEFVNAARVLNKGVPKEDRMRFLHFDLQRHSREASIALSLLSKVAAEAVNLTGVFCGKLISVSQKERTSSLSVPKCRQGCTTENSNTEEGLHVPEDSANDYCNLCANSLHETLELQKGILRTNCIDCLDRTNVAQYAYGLVAMKRQLHALGVLKSPELDSNHPVAEQLMDLYEAMGDTLALQYGGSPAHNKIFSERRGQWRATIQSQDLWKSLQRYYSNAWIDGEKQNAINLFLGSFQPQLGKPSLWEISSDHQQKIAGYIKEEGARSFLIRSLSDGNLQSQRSSPISSRDLAGKDQLLDRTRVTSEGLSESSPEIPACLCLEANFREELPDVIEEDEQANRVCRCGDKHYRTYEISSSANSCDEEPHEIVASWTEHDDDGSKHKVDTDNNFGDPDSNFTRYFMRWVDEGGLFYHC